MGILDIFRSRKAIDDVLDKDNGHLAKLGGWIGNANFTEEERAEVNTGVITAVQQFTIDTLSENTDRSRARREIAVFIIKFYALLVFMAGMTYPIDSEWSGVWFSLATSAALGGLVSAISIFFFGSHVLAKWQKGKKEK